MITCSLHVQSFDNLQPDSYSALSYVWGPDSPKKAVYIDNCEIFVLPNLYAVLRRLRAHNAGRSVRLFADALCIDQSNMAERNHQVTLMGRVYSQCSEVTVWFGELAEVDQRCFSIDATDVGKTKSYQQHPLDCQCKQEELSTSISATSSMSQSTMAIVAAPVLLRLAQVQRCGDFSVCRLFDTIEEMIALRYLLSDLGNNEWFKRMWTTQEGLLARNGRLYFGPVCVPFESIFQVAKMWDTHWANLCCMRSMTALNSIVVPFVRPCFALGNGRLQFYGDQNCDLFTMRSRFTGRKASLAVDLLYGLLGVAKSAYNIIPDYSRSVKDVYTDASKRFLQAYAPSQTFWIFIYSAIKNRYPELPSWAVDWTILESSVQRDARHVWARMQRLFESRSPDRRSPELDTSVKFRCGAMMLYAQHLDTIAEIGGVLNLSNTKRRRKRYFKVLASWRDMILAYRAPTDIYEVLAAFEHRDSRQYTWDIAWLTLLCAGHVALTGDQLHRLSTSELQTLWCDAAHHSKTPFFLEATSRGPKHAGKMQLPKLYGQALLFVGQVLEGKRIFITTQGYLGLGNGNVQQDDKIYLPMACNTLLVLRSSKNLDQKNCSIVSTCYLQGFMDGPQEDLNVPVEDLQIV
jgi:hypothetical protein